MTFGLMGNPPRAPMARDEEEEEEEAQEWTMTEKRCEACSDRLHFTEEIVHVGVSHAVSNGSETLIMPFLCDDGQYEGDFYYTPLFFEFDCWEDLAESLRKMVEDAPPVRHPDQLLECNFCECSILEGEIFGTAYVGELHVSKRMPASEPTSTFMTIAKPYIICIGCLVLINEHECELWYDNIDQVGECQECTHIRCWRYENECSCPCHDEGSEHAEEEGPTASGGD